MWALARAMWMMLLPLAFGMMSNTHVGDNASLGQDEQPGRDTACAAGPADAAIGADTLQTWEADCPVIDIPEDYVEQAMQTYQMVFGDDHLHWSIGDSMTISLDPELWRLRFIASVFYTQTNVEEQAETVHMMTISCPSATSSTAIPQLLPESCPETRKLRRRKRTSLRVAYDPQLPNHCWFQCVMRALHLPVEEGAIMAFREMLAQRWEEHPDWLSAVASYEGLSQAQYLAKLKTTLWGGAPEMMLMNRIFGLDFEVVDIAQNVLFATNGQKPIRLLRHRNHFYLLHGQPDMRDIARMIARGQARRADGNPTVTTSHRGGMPLTLTDNTGVTITVQTVEDEEDLQVDEHQGDRSPIP